MKKTMLALVVLVLFLPAFSQEETDEKYLCVTEKSTGFKYNKVTRSWDVSSVRLEEQ